MGASAQGPNALIGQIVAGYRLERVLGMGATGAVFLGTRIAAADDAGTATPTDAASPTPPTGEATAAAAALPPTAAIKLLFVPWQLSDEQAEDFRRRFLREAATLSQLRHPHLLPVLASGRDDATGHLYMVMPHVAGTLAARLTAGGALALDEAGSILDQLAGALDYAHSQGVIHRDIKPANILLDERGQAYLGDFGILRLLDESRTQLTATGGVLGTPEYMAPEQARGDDVGPAADRYSLAVVLYQMVTGHLPFEGGTPASVIVRQMQDPPPIPRSYRADLPQPAEAVILKGLAKRPEDRFALATQLSQAFAEGLAGILSPLVTPTGPQQAQTLSDGRVLETPATPPSPTPLPWMPYPEAPALAGPVAGVAVPPRRRRGMLWGTLGAAVLLLLVASVLAALLRPDLAQALFGGKAATATATQGQVAQATFTPSPTATATATPRPTATATPRPTATTAPVVIPTNTPVPPPSGPAVYIGSYDVTLYALDAATGTVRWRFPTGGPIFSSPALVSGVVYVGSWDNNVYALNATDGSVLWKYATGAQVYSSPAVVNGVVYVGSWDDSLYALNASDGSLIWRFSAGGAFTSSPTVANGLVYIGCDDNHVYAVNAQTGSQQWSFQTGDKDYAPPVVYGGNVYVSSRDSFVYALNAASGSLVWKYQTGSSVWGAPTVAGNVVYVGSDDHYFYALDAGSGAVIWRYLTGGGFSSATIGNGLVYVGDTDHNLYAINPSNGSVNWTFTAQGAVVSSPVISNGMLFVGSDDSNVYAVNPYSGALIWQYQTGGAVHSTAVVG